MVDNGDAGADEAGGHLQSLLMLLLLLGVMRCAGYRQVCLRNQRNQIHNNPKIYERSTDSIKG